MAVIRSDRERRLQGVPAHLPGSACAASCAAASAAFHVALWSRFRNERTDGRTLHVDQSGRHAALSGVRRYYLEEQDIPMSLWTARDTKRIGLACLPRPRNAHHSSGLE